MTTQRPLRVCHVVASLNEQTGGPAQSVSGLVASLPPGEVDGRILCLDYASLGPQLRPPGVRVDSIPADFVARHLRGYSSRLRTKLLEIAFDNLTILHNHGLWMLPNCYCRQAGMKAGIPVVVSPRGMLEPWSLGNGRIRKRLAWRLYERRNLDSARAFHATSTAELESIRAAGFTQPVAVIPNGVDVPSEPSAVRRDALECAFPDLSGRRWLLFMSRLHAKKGLDALLRTWKSLAEKYPDWILLIAGGDSPGERGKYQQLARELQLTHCVLFTGNLSGEQKSAALAHSELLVLPTHSENFGMVVAEALAHGTPVLTTHGAPWEGLRRHQCGWWIESAAHALACSMDEALTLPEDERQAMGARGRQWMARDYSWERVGMNMAHFYQWIVEGGQRPQFVDCTT